MQRLSVNKNGIDGWYCSIHNVYNDILREHCCYCTEPRDVSLAVRADYVRWRRTGWLTEGMELKMAETERELHAEFFTRWSDDERMLIKDMTDDELTAHRNELARIALESKVRTTTADEEIRQRRAKKGSDSRQWLVPTDVNSAIEGVRKRGERMSKEDKIIAMMKDLGVEGAEGLIKKATDNQLKKFTIVKSDKVTDEKKDDEPFDFSKLE